MPVEPWTGVTTQWGFLLTLARVGGLFAAIPMPGARSLADPARVLFVLALTMGLSPVWPKAEPAGMGQVAFWLLTEMAFGLGVGLALGFAAEAIVLCSQALALQAGFSYATTIDPSSQADSSVLQVLAQLSANFFFYAVGMDHVAVRALARSMETFPPGTALATLPWLEAVSRGGAAMLETGLRLALPVLGLLLLTDLCLSLAARIQSQLQLLSLAFPLKMLIALAALAASWPLAVWAYRTCAGRNLAVLRALGGA
jgi:flagellar biosynthetic protein FliR